MKDIVFHDILFLERARPADVRAPGLIWNGLGLVLLNQSGPPKKFGALKYTAFLCVLPV